jgi:exopolysaccharide biosynthesis polyprenyl glycosylphosphotransferase
MTIRSRAVVLNVVKALYLGLLLLAFGSATILLYSKHHNPAALSDFLSMRVRLANFVVLAFLIFAWHGVFLACRFYDSKRLSTLSTIVKETVLASTLTTVVLGLMALLFRVRMASILFIVIFWCANTCILLTARISTRYLLGVLRSRGWNQRHIVILGSNSRAIKFAQKIESEPGLGCRVVGFVDDPWSGQQAFKQSGYSLCSDLDSISEFLRRNVVDEVVIYLPIRTFHEYAAQVAAICELHGIMIRFASDIVDLKIARPFADELYGTSHIAAHSLVSSEGQLLTKRGFDLLIATVLLIALSPLLMAIAVLIKCSSKGPILFWQERIGFNKRRFRICKFRTMVPDAEALMATLEASNEASGPVFKIKNDPRITAVGRLLRRTSLDEIPQLLNVVKGEMSLVGPRPLPVRDYEGFHEDWQRRRFSIRPGITCLWQVNGRSSISFDRWMLLDLEYIDKWSFWLDLKILAQTVPAVLKGTGAV